MTGSVIKEFLVGLGFGVDDASLSKFNKSIKEASIRVTALAATVTAAAVGIFASVTKISEGFEEMGYEFHIISPAINKALVLRNELLKSYQAAGINIGQVVANSVRLNLSVTKTKYALEAIYKSVGSRFFTLLTKQSDIFRGQIYRNMPKIQAMLERLVKFLFKAFEAVVELGTRMWSILTRVYDFFVMLDQKTDGWSTIILAVIAAWKLLNLEFLATPLGMIIAGLVAILALFDDFETWKEGGKSLFDWSKFVPVIDAVKNALSKVWDVLNGIGKIVADVALLFYQAFQGDWTGALDTVKTLISDLINQFKMLWETAKSFLNVGEAVGTWAQKVFGALDFSKGIKSIPGQLINPVGSDTVNNNGGNQQVSQQTNINVSGSANADQTAKAVAGSQSRVNFDMVRNLKGATR